MNRTGNTFDGTERPKVHAGWYFDLPLNKERVVRDPVYRNGILIIITSRPENDPCSAGGRSIIHEIDACTGGRLDTAQFDINDDGVIDEHDLIHIAKPAVGDPGEDLSLVPPTGMEVDAMIFPPVILIMPDGEREVKYFMTQVEVLWQSPRSLIKEACFSGDISGDSNINVETVQRLSGNKTT